MSSNFPNLFFPTPMFQYYQNPYPICNYTLMKSEEEIILNFHSQIQIQFSKNLDFIKSKYRKQISPNFEFHPSNAIANKASSMYSFVFYIEFMFFLIFN